MDPTLLPKTAPTSLTWFPLRAHSVPPDVEFPASQPANLQTDQRNLSNKLPGLLIMAASRL